jgi:hypothetical protein
MSDENKPKPGASNDPEEPMQGVNLKLIYSLIALAILAAIAVAFLIVLPLYNHKGP